MCASGFDGDRRAVHVGPRRENAANARLVLLERRIDLLELRRHRANAALDRPDHRIELGGELRRELVGVALGADLEPLGRRTIRHVHRAA